MLIEIAVGDSYGVPYEFVDFKIIIESNKGWSYAQHPIHRINPGCYSDDTQMSIGLAEFMIDNRKNLFDKRTLAKYFLNAFKRDERKGYSRGFQALLESVSDENELIQKIETHGKSDKGGGAMRVCPVGLLNDIDLIKNFSKFQAELTHEKTAIIAAQAAALSVYWFKNCLEQELENLYDWLNSTLGSDIDWVFSGGEVKARNDLGLLTVKAAIDAALHTTTLQEAIVRAVSYGGDTDTVAAITAGMVSNSVFHDKSIPDSLYYGLENKKYGRDYIEILDKKLMEKQNV